MEIFTKVQNLMIGDLMVYTDTSVTTEILGVYPGDEKTLLVCQHGDDLYSISYPNNLVLKVMRSVGVYYGKEKKSNEE